MKKAKVHRAANQKTSHQLLSNVIVLFPRSLWVRTNLDFSASNGGRSVMNLNTASIKALWSCFTIANFASLLKPQSSTSRTLSLDVDRPAVEKKTHFKCCSKQNYLRFLMIASNFPSPRQFTFMTPILTWLSSRVYAYAMRAKLG